MAWIGVSLEGTILNDQQPTTGAIEALTNLMQNGHRVTIISDKFVPAPNEYKQAIKQHIEQFLKQLGIPYSEIWTGGYKPACDIFIDSKAVNFDQDWNMALAQTNMMLSGV
jgi:hypothetical protein